jgi:hypothetical protein
MNQALIVHFQNILFLYMSSFQTVQTADVQAKNVTDKAFGKVNCLNFKWNCPISGQRTAGGAELVL